MRPIDNPPNPWDAATVEWIGEPPPARLEIFHDKSRSILSENNSPDIPFRWSVNPYRGCMHGCAYCYARPSHEHLSFGAGTDFERRIVVKPEAPTLLEAAFRKASWQGELVVFSGNTDCYQPVEASYRLTRACLEVCRDFKNPVGVITKSPLIERDLDVLTELAAVTHVSVVISVPFIDDAHARALEPWVPPPARRLKAIKRLAAAGVSVGVNVAPVIPGLTDAEMPQVLEAAREAGATFAGTTLVRLPGPVAQVFEQRLRETLPLRADRVMNQIRATHGGETHDARFGARMKGTGVQAELIRRLFRQTCKRLGYQPHPNPPTVSPFERPPAPGDQLALFF